MRIGEKSLFSPGLKKLAALVGAVRRYAVAGGKGGVGKSLLTANLGFATAQRGTPTVLLDADLGCPNLHTYLGVKSARVGLADFLAGRTPSLEKSAVKTGRTNLRMVSAFREALSAQNLTYFEKLKIIQNLPSLSAECLFMDLSAGTSFNTLDFFLAAKKGILVVLPEPASVENLYRFLKALIHRRVSRISKDKAMLAVFNEAERQGGASGLNFMGDILNSAQRVSPSVATAIEESVRGMCGYLIVNQAREAKDRKLGENIADIIRRHFGMDVTCAGTVSYDPAVRRCTQEGKLLLESEPTCTAAHDILRISEFVTT